MRARFRTPVTEGQTLGPAPRFGAVSLDPTSATSRTGYVEPVDRMVPSVVTAWSQNAYQTLRIPGSGWTPSTLEMASELH
jgi:hypothetical protein